MTTQGYVAPLADLHFVLFEQLDVEGTLGGLPPFAGQDRDTWASVLEEGARLATEVLAPVDRIGDREGVRLDADGNVTTPAAFKEAWQAMQEGGWLGVDAPPEYGGFGLPHVVGIAVSEMFSGAAMAFAMYPGLTTSAARVLAQFAPEPMRQVLCSRMFGGVWAGTMCLTEAGAGSDVGANRTVAHRTDEPGVYLLEGEKIFISGGDQDLTENICHLVLARTPDAPPGTRGLSLFLVPKFLFDADGNLGERNGVYVRGIEEKMGLHGSATCTLVLGDAGPCRGWLLGREGEGMPIMFHMMNEARIAVGAQGLSIGHAAYANALAYARDRQQGSSIEHFKDASAPRVSILKHPDVRRMFLHQKARLEALRSLVLRAALLSDVAKHATDEATRAKAQGWVDLMTPVIKAHGADVGFESAVTALQCMGGYGYIGEYPVEQRVRDAKITSIYEGTNGIQAVDLLGRKLRMENGALFMGWLQDAQARCATAREAGLDAAADAVDKALGHLGATAMHLAGLAMQGQLGAAMLQATPFLRLFGIVALAVESLDQAIVATRAIAAGDETPLRAGKLLNLRYYVAQVLPEAVAIAKAIQTDDGAALDERLWA